MTGDPRRSRLRALGPARLRLLVVAMLLMPALALAARLLGTRRLRRYLCAVPITTAPPPAGRRLPIALDVADIVVRAARLSPWSPTCLHRSTALWWLLRRRGIETRIRFGVRSAGGTMAFHAWVELDGRVLGDRPNIAVGQVLLDML